MIAEAPQEAPVEEDPDVRAALLGIDQRTVEVAYPLLEDSAGSAGQAVPAAEAEDTLRSTDQDTVEVDLPVADGTVHTDRERRRPTSVLATDTEKSIRALVRDYLLEKGVAANPPVRYNTHSFSAERQNNRTWQELQADGEATYDEATERHKTHGLDEETVALYKKASQELHSSLFMSPSTRPKDVGTLVKMAACVGWQAEAAEPGVFYTDRGSSHIDIKSNLQAIAQRTAAEAVALLLGERRDDAVVPAEVEVSPEVVAEAAVEAAKEAGTDDYVVVRGIGGVDAETPHRLEEEGPEAILRFMGEHAMDPKHGGEFTAVFVEKIEEETGVHNFSLAS